jgi:hypothetical protein
MKINMQIEKKKLLKLDAIPEKFPSIAVPVKIIQSKF